VGLQAKLLRVLQEGEIRRVGDQKTRRVDVRVLAATARDLAAEAAAGRFRKTVLPAQTSWPSSCRRCRAASGHRASGPPLRRAPGPRFGRPLTLTDGAIAWLEEQEWRGNVRELENTIERRVLTDGTFWSPEISPTPTPHPPRPWRQVVGHRRGCGT